ncbi:MAG: glycosyltransferase family 4 protein [Ilumatobacteraceae bacterium]
MKHLLVTNDFPPKIGGIQNLLWEWWRRLPPDSFAVLTSPHKDSKTFDADQNFEIHRVRESVLLPHPLMVQRINRMASRFNADFVVLDPAVPLGLVGPSLKLPYMVVVHGAEVTVPGRLPISRQALSYVLRRAEHVIAAGGFPAAQAQSLVDHQLPMTVIPPGVDTGRFVPLTIAERVRARDELGISQDAQLIIGISRLVPRKGFDILIKAVAQLRKSTPNLVVVIGGAGRDRARLERMANELKAPVRFMGRVANDLMPKLYGCADIYAMLCRSRWGGLEQEGFGIVFAEAASCGIPQIAGNSGGAAEAVLDGVTGRVVANPSDVQSVIEVIQNILTDNELRSAMGLESRRRALELFDYDVLTKRLASALQVAM